MAFDKNRAMRQHGVDNELDLRQKFYGDRSDIGEPELKKMCECLNEFESPTYFEVGIYFGGTLRRVMDHLKSNHASYSVYGFDLFQDILKGSEEEQTHKILNRLKAINVAYIEELENYFNKSGYTNFKLIKGDSSQTVSDIDTKVDVSFIDGNHTYKAVQKDFVACYEKSKLGSWLIFDNSTDNIEPDASYVKKDGGPWKLCQELKNDARFEFHGLVGRCSFFKVIAK